MKPTEIKKQKLMLNKKSISNLTETEMSIINGGLVTKPTPTIILPDTTPIGLPSIWPCETLIGCPCTI